MEATNYDTPSEPEKNIGETKDGEQEEADTIVGSEEIVQLHCDPCNAEGTHALAEGYCQTCEEYLCNHCFAYHCKPRPMRNHILVDSENMPRPRPHLEENNGHQEMCPIHEYKPLSRYCRNHNAFLCAICVANEHKTCDDVSCLKDCAKGIATRQEYCDFKKEAKAFENNFSTKIGIVTSHLDKINILSTKTKTSEAIKKLTAFADSIKEMEEDMSNMIQMGKTTTARYKDVLSKVQECSEESDSDTLKFIMMKRGQSIIRQSNAELENLKQEMANFEKCLNRFDASKYTSLLCDVEKCFGIDAKAISLPERYIEVISRKEVDVSTSGGIECRITGSAMLSDGCIAFADYENSSINVFSLSTKKVTASLTLASKPFDVVEVEKGSIAVTMPKKKMIQFLSYRKERMARDRDIHVKGTCYGIACHKDELFVAFDDPPKVKVIDMDDGDVVDSFSRGNRDGRLFVSPRYIAYNAVNSKLYVSDREKETVTCMTTTGEVISIYRSESLQRPVGITVDVSGTVYVCARKTEQIHCLTPDFRLLRVIKINASSKPECICWNEKDILFVGLYEDDEVLKIKIRKLWH